MQCNVTPVKFLGTNFHFFKGDFHDFADITAESFVSRSFEWNTTLCIGKVGAISNFTAVGKGRGHQHRGRQGPGPSSAVVGTVGEHQHPTLFYGADVFCS